MIKVGDYNDLKVLRSTSIGLYLDDGDEGILLPKRFVPENATLGDEIKVFVYHDKENRLIATTQTPHGKIYDIVLLKCITSTKEGAYLDMGLMKDLFVPMRNQQTYMVEGQQYLIKLYLDQVSGKIVGTERLEPFLSNDLLTVQVNDEVNLIAYRKTNLGFLMIINNQYLGLLHNNEIYRDLKPGDKMNGYIKSITASHKIDLVLGKQGYKRTEDESEKIISMLKENNGFLPYHDKTDPETIYKVFSMSKKTFKMTIGRLYKSKKVNLEKDGIRLN